MSELAENPLEIWKNSESWAWEINSQAWTTQFQVWKTLFPGIFFRIWDAAALVESLGLRRKKLHISSPIK